MARILFLMPYFQEFGGTERVVVRLAGSLTAKHDVHVCALSAEDSIDVNAYAFPVHIMPGRRRLPLPFRWVIYLAEARWVKSLKGAVAADVAISSLWRADLVNVLSGGRDRKVSILHAGVGGSKANAMLERLHLLAAPIYCAFDRVVAVTAEVGKEAIRLYGLRADCVVTIPNASDFNLSEKSARKSDVVWCGRFVEEKNPQGAVEVFRQLLRQQADLAVAMIGDGPLLAECEEAAGEFASKDLRPGRIAFLGGVPRAALLIGSSRLLVSTSRVESFGLVLLEAMGQGVPVAAADAISGGPHEVLGAKSPHNPARASAEQTKAGYLLPMPIDAPSIDLWVQTIGNIIKSPQLLSKLKTGALERAGDFSPAKIDRQWDALLDELL